MAHFHTPRAVQYYCKQQTIFFPIKQKTKKGLRLLIEAERYTTQHMMKQYILPSKGNKQIDDIFLNSLTNSNECCDHRNLDYFVLLQEMIDKQKAKLDSLVKERAWYDANGSLCAKFLIQEFLNSKDKTLVTDSFLIPFTPEVLNDILGASNPNFIKIYSKTDIARAIRLRSSNPTTNFLKKVFFHVHKEEITM
jgi:hypothetical protein